MADTIWLRTLAPERRALIERSDDPPPTADIVIIGGGLIGLATAYYLSQAGAGSICVIDRSGVAAEASGANAGGLWFAHESAGGGFSAELARFGGGLYDELRTELDFEMHRDGFLELLWDESDLRGAQAKATSLKPLGFRAEVLSEGELRRAEPALAPVAAGALLTPDDGQVHPVELAAAWVERLRARGVRLCHGVEATGLGLTVETSRGSIAAGTVVIACGAWTPLVTQAVGWRPPIRPLRGALLALPALEPGMLRHTVMGRRYYCWQLGAGPIVAGGSEEDVGFEHGVEDATIDAIREELAALFPALAQHSTVCAWSGLRPYCEDGLPVIGVVPGQDRLFVAAGHFRKGVMLAPATGKLLADLILHGETALDLAPLSPARFTAAAL